MANKNEELILKSLRDRHNVLISGVPGCGKSLLMGNVAQLFVGEEGPSYQPAKKAFLASHGNKEIPDWHPSPTCNQRKVFSTAFHQGTKFRDFVRGVIPDLREGRTGFRVTSGVLYEAAEFAKQEGCAALLIIDEINRGPTVEAFGDAIVALESDKRLDENGNIQATSQSFRVLDDQGDYEDYYLPKDLYLLAAMNQADTSVQGMDVAFLRRWEPFRIEPDYEIARSFFGIKGERKDQISEGAVRVYDQLIEACVAVNKRIRRGRGPEYRVGHGILLTSGLPPTDEVGAAEYAAAAWARVYTHIEEVFFGDIRGMATTLNIQGQNHPLTLEEDFFGDMPVLEMDGDPQPNASGIEKLLKAVAGTTTL